MEKKSCLVRPKRRGLRRPGDELPSLPLRMSMPNWPPEPVQRPLLQPDLAAARLPA